MQTPLILLASAFAVASASIFPVVPVSYIARSPLPVYNHVQDTRTGEYAYNYAGGPSAKEEIKTLDGVTRGAYSYVDGFGIVQSAQYIADGHGFRVAATNVPTDAQIGVNVPLETPEVQAAKAAHFAEHAKAIAALGRRKRSLAYAPTAVSSQYHNQEHESVKIETPVYQQYVSAAPLAYASYQHVPVAVASAPSAVSHQSRVQTHNAAHLEVSSPISYAHIVPNVEVFRTVPDQVISYQEAIEVPAAHVEAVHVSPVAVSSVPTAVSSQSRYQVHNSQKLEVQSPVYETVAAPVVPVAPQADAVIVDSSRAAVPVVSAVASVPTAVSSQSRYQVHNSQKLEVQSPVYEAVAAPVVPVAPQVDSVIVESSRLAVPAVSVASVPTAVSSQSRTQIHNGQRLEIEAPQVYAAQVVDSYGYPTVDLSAAALAAPVAVSSQSRTQVHSGHSLEVEAPVYGASHLVPQVPLDTPEVAAAKQAHAKAYAEELAKHQGW